MLRDGLRPGHHSAPVDRVIVGRARGADDAEDLKIVGEYHSTSCLSIVSDKSLCFSRCDEITARFHAGF